jgi:V8-like Glu-specific endopeptidase
LAVALLLPAGRAHAEAPAVRPGTGTDAPMGDGSTYEVRVAAVAVGKPDLTRVRGTAFLIGPRGLMATADHLVDSLSDDDLKQLFVLRPTPPTVTASKATLVKRFKTGDSTRDIAFLQISRKPEDPDLPFFELAGQPQVGEEVFLVGYPLVFDKVYRWPLFRFGRISSVKYFLRDSKVLVLDLTSASGFSGSPVIRRSDGKVLGVQKGGATGNKQADFSLATVLTTADLPSSDAGTADRPAP